MRQTKFKFSILHLLGVLWIQTPTIDDGQRDMKGRLKLEESDNNISYDSIMRQLTSNLL